MDFRNQHFGKSTATKPGDRISPLFWVLGQNLIIGLITSFVLFARVDAYTFAFVTQAVALIVVTTTLLVEVQETIMGHEDARVIGHLPVSDRVIVGARLVNLLMALGLYTVSTHLFPAIVGMGLADAGWIWLPMYVLDALLMTFIVAGLVVCAYLFGLRRGMHDHFRDYLAWTQVILILLLFYGGQAALRDGQRRLEWYLAQLPDWMAWTPPGLIARHLDAVCAHGATAAWWIPASAAVLAVAVWVPALRWLLGGRVSPGSAPPMRRPKPGRALVRPGDLRGPLMRRLFRDPATVVGYWMSVTSLRRDPEVRMRCWPNLAMVVAPLLLGLFLGALGQSVGARRRRKLEPDGHGADRVSRACDRPRFAGDAHAGGVVVAGIGTHRRSMGFGPGHVDGDATAPADAGVCVVGRRVRVGVGRPARRRAARLGRRRVVLGGGFLRRSGCTACRFPRRARSAAARRRGALRWRRC